VVENDVREVAVNPVVLVEHVREEVTLYLVLASVEEEIFLTSSFRLRRTYKVPVTVTSESNTDAIPEPLSETRRHRFWFLPKRGLRWVDLQDRFWWISSRMSSGMLETAE
jgi:hypothetical protein